MSKSTISRRKALQLIGLTAGASAISPVKTMAASAKKVEFTFCLNMATIHGHKLGFMKELETASQAGFRSVEIWMDTLQDYLKGGGTIKEVKTRLNDLGLKVENNIGFAQWIVDDEAIRKQAIEQLKTEMALLAEIGCPRIAATGKGLTNDTTISLDTIAEQYRTVLELGEQYGVTPLMEMWGFQKMLSRVSEVTYIAMQSGHKSAKILLDVFHLYKGNTPLETLSFINPGINPILHMNDYPATLSQAVITDANRIYPGDGVAPIKQILQTLKHHDQPLILSAELFNAAYYKQDAILVAKTALEKMKRVAEGV
jgi:2-keto-myo-inositol isomerase